MRQAQGKCCLDRWRGPIFLGTVLGAARGPDINEKGLLSRDEPNFQENGASPGDQALSSMKMWCRRGGRGWLQAGNVRADWGLGT